MYRAQEDHWAPKIAGFLLVPVAGALAAQVVGSVADRTRATDQDVWRTMLLTNALAQIGVAYLSYRASERSDLSLGTQAFARGGLWGSMISAALTPVAAALPAPRQLGR